MSQRPDHLDRMVYTETTQLRKLYREACARLGQTPRQLTPVVLMQRSVR